VTIACFGVVLPSSGPALDPGELLETAAPTEEHGFDSAQGNR
jgi:hypothetical protein